MSHKCRQKRCIKFIFHLQIIIITKNTTFCSNILDFAHNNPDKMPKLPVNISVDSYKPSNHSFEIEGVTFCFDFCSCCQ